jgi:hypothetical protein
LSARETTVKYLGGNIFPRLHPRIFKSAKDQELFKKFGLSPVACIRRGALSYNVFDPISWLQRPAEKRGFVSGYDF